jgi:arylsulfatase A-like enzyme
MILTDFYAASSVCGPSRGGLMTGKHTGHASVVANTQSLNADVDTTVAQVLKRADYKTALFGKWHLGNGSRVMPGAMGFDVVLRERWDTGGHYFTPEYIQNYPYRLYYHDTTISGDEEYVVEENLNTARGYYLDDINTDWTIDFMQQNRDNSFFVFTSWKTPHSPEEFNDISQFAAENWSDLEKRHAARILSIDRNVGQVLSALDDLGIAEHTLVLLTSDNGPHNEGGHKHEFFDSNGDLRGFKRDLYEGGIREPTIAWWKGVIEPGSVSNHVAAFWDVLATAAELAGVNTDPEDGISFLPALKGEQQQQAHDYLYWQFPGNGIDRQAVRQGKWKGVSYNEAPIEVYDLENDIGEENNLAGSRPDIAAMLDSLISVAGN